MKRVSAIALCAATLATVLVAAPGFAQAPAPGQGGLSPDTPTLAPVQPGASTPAGADAGPKTPLPPRDTPRAPQPGQQQRQAAAPVDPDWPCVQRKVPSLSYGQMWSGPDIQGEARNWRQDREVAALSATLVARKTSMEEAKAAIADFAAKAGNRKAEKLTALFAAVFEQLNDERSKIVDGIERYARKQRALSEKIKEQSLKIASSQQDMASQMSPEGQQEQQALDWDTRIYDERQQSLSFVCDTPVILEQRAFDLGREIQSALE